MAEWYAFIVYSYEEIHCVVNSSNIVLYMYIVIAKIHILVSWKVETASQGCVIKVLYLRS